MLAGLKLHRWPDRAGAGCPEHNQMRQEKYCQLWERKMTNIVHQTDRKPFI
jgi:hypothetical protein